MLFHLQSKNTIFALVFTDLLSGINYGRIQNKFSTWQKGILSKLFLFLTGKQNGRKI